MPTYEYACPTCGIVECFQSIKDAPHTKCPTCRKAKVSRLVSSGAGVIFKGSGFWETDYNRSADYKKKASSESGEGSSGENAPAKPKVATKMKKVESPVNDSSLTPAP
jgi:putative FmdB family regulatory protein